MRSLKKSMANPFKYEYAVGISALNHNQKPEKVTNDIKKAIQEAFLAGLNFIVEFGPRGKRILSWNYAVCNKRELVDRYPYNPKQRSILASSTDEFWLTIKTNADEILLPMSEVGRFKKLDISKYL